MKLSIVFNFFLVSALAKPAFEEKDPYQIIKDTIQDETLVHSTLLKENTTVPEGSFRIEVQSHELCVYDVKPRPGVEKFLEALAQVYELVLYTAGKKKYAEPIINHIDQNNVFKFKFYEDACKIRYGIAIKSMDELEERNENNTFAIDDGPMSFGFKNTKVIAIPPYEGKEGDNVLTQLLPTLLEGRLSVEKIKEINKEYGIEV